MNMVTLCADHKIRTKRTIVERGYGRVKSQWPILTRWVGKRENSKTLFYDACALTNIDMKRNPLKARCCEGGSFGPTRDKCILCTLLPEREYTKTLRYEGVPFSGVL